MEKINEKKPTIVVDAIYASRNNPNGENRTLQLRWVTEKVGGSNVLSQFFKGSGFQENRVVFQAMHQDYIRDFNLKAGMNINDVLDVPIRLTVQEYTHSEYLALKEQNENKVKMFSPKKNPETNEYLVSEDGEYIYRGIVITDVDAKDKYVRHVGSVEEEPEEETVINNQLTV